MDFRPFGRAVSSISRETVRPMAWYASQFLPDVLSEEGYECYNGQSNINHATKGSRSIDTRLHLEPTMVLITSHHGVMVSSMKSVFYSAKRRKD